MRVLVYVSKTVISLCHNVVHFRHAIVLSVSVIMLLFVCILFVCVCVIMYPFALYHCMICLIFWLIACLQGAHNTGKQNTENGFKYYPARKSLEIIWKVCLVRNCLYMLYVCLKNINEYISTH